MMSQAELETILIMVIFRIKQVARFLQGVFLVIIRLLIGWQPQPAFSAASPIGLGFSKNISRSPEKVPTFKQLIPYRYYVAFNRDATPVNNFSQFGFRFFHNAIPFYLLVQGVALKGQW